MKLEPCADVIAPMPHLILTATAGDMHTATIFGDLQTPSKKTINSARYILVGYRDLVEPHTVRTYECTFCLN